MAELSLVENCRVLRDPLEPEALRQLLKAEVLLVGGESRPQQRDVVIDGFGEVAGLAELLDRGGAVALRELLAVGAVEQWEVCIARRLGAQGAEHEQLLG